MMLLPQLWRFTISLPSVLSFLFLFLFFFSRHCADAWEKDVAQHVLKVPSLATAVLGDALVPQSVILAESLFNGSTV